jgi:hypothetical protein
MTQQIRDRFAQPGVRLRPGSALALAPDRLPGSCAVQALGYHALQAGRPHGLDHVSEAGVQLLTVATEFTEPRQDVTAQVASPRKWLGHHVPAREDQQRKHRGR